MHHSITVGECSPQHVAAILETLSVLPDTLIVVSTDLSHFMNYSQAKQKDLATIHKIEDRISDISGDMACGCHAVNGLLQYSRHKNWQPHLVNYANSGDVHANRDEVVGYASFVLY